MIYSPPPLNEEVILEIIDKKTGTLFEISFAFGWLFGGGEISSLREIKKAARSFGRAFQIHDDLDDIDQGGLNYASVVGEEKAKAMIKQELQNYYQSLDTLRLTSPELLALGQFA